MARCPFATWRPIDVRFLSGARMAVYNRMNLHVAGSNGSLWGYFNAAARPSSHFWVARDGAIEQYIDTATQGEADYEGNDATISVETSGGATNADGEPWSPEQVESLARLFAWAVTTHGIRRQLAWNAIPGDGSKGLSWHRLGIDGNFPAGDLGGRLQRGGGMHYSTKDGKVCPGNAKIRQIPDIFARASAILDGGVVNVSNPVVVVTPAAPVAPAARNVAEAQATQRALHQPDDGDWGDGTDHALNLVRAAINGQFPDGVAAVQRIVGAAPDDVWGAKSKRALKATVAALQRAWGVGSDGVWGRVTEGGWTRARARNYKAWER